MGKAEIISGGDGGLYQVDIIYDISRITASIAKLTAQIDKIDAVIAGADPENKDLPFLRLQAAALRKTRAGLETIPEKKRASAWAADLSIALSGLVGTAEVPDDPDPAGGFNIVPAGELGVDAVYALATHGIINPIMNMGPASAWFLRAIMPGVQKYQPMFRYGTITEKDGDKCGVDLASAPDVNGESVNQSLALSNVDIVYLSCNGAAFKVDDVVLVQFDRAWDTPRVVGFRTDPQPCGELLFIAQGDKGLVWDMETADFAAGILDAGGAPITFPCLLTELAPWLAATSEVGYTETFWEFESRPSSKRLEAPDFEPYETGTKTDDRPEGTCNGDAITTSYITVTKDYTREEYDMNDPAISVPAIKEWFYTEIDEHNHYFSYYPYICAVPLVPSGGFEGYSIDFLKGYAAVIELNRISAWFLPFDIVDNYYDYAWEYTMTSPIGAEAVNAGYTARSYSDPEHPGSFITTVDGTHFVNYEPQATRVVKHTDNSVVQFYVTLFQKGVKTAGASIPGDIEVVPMIAVETEPDGLAETGYSLQGALRVPQLEAAVVEMFGTDSTFFSQWAPTIEFRQ